MTKYLVKWQTEGRPVRSTEVIIEPGYSTARDIPKIIALGVLGDATLADSIRIIGKRRLTPPYKVVPPSEFCAGWRVESKRIGVISKPVLTEAEAQQLCDDMNAAVTW